VTVEEAIRHRRSIRRFLPDAVNVKDLREMLALAALAPNVSNRQMWRFIVVIREELRHMLAHLVEAHLTAMGQWPECVHEGPRLRAWQEQALHFAAAPACIFVVNQGYRTPLDQILVEHGMRHWETAGQFGHPDIQSVSCAMAYFTLLAEERGYATCWLTAPLVARHDLHIALECKPGEELLAVLTIGKPAESPLPKPRKPVDETIRWM